jgi:uncharacterized protein YjbI with pentapeptide repeats
MTEKNKDIGNGQETRTEQSVFLEFPPKLQGILEAHHLWLESQGNDGKQANLSGWDLSGLDLAERDLREINFEDTQLAKANLYWAKLDRANLRGANLQEADLSRANLQGANLRRANLEKADLTEANLRNTKLQEAKFQETNVLKTEFFDADLRDTNLSHSQNLLSRQLAGANLTACELPQTVSRFEELDHASEITKTTATLLWTLLTGCLYAGLTVANTTDASFYVSASTLKLPILDATIPTWGFFILAPIVLLGWYFYFLLNLQRLWEGLITLPAHFPDGMRLDQKATPWFIAGLAYSYFPQLKTQKPAFLRTQKFLSLVLVWWIVPLTLIFVWINYLKARFWPITLVQILAIGLATFLGFRTWQVAKATLQRETPRPPKKILVYAFLPFLFLSLLWVSEEVINLVPPGLEPELVAEYESQQKLGPIRYGLFGYYLDERIATWPFIGSMVKWFFSRPFVNIDFEELSKMPTGEKTQDLEKITDEKELIKHLARIKGADLHSSNLRHSRAQQVFLARANLSGANLSGAYLVGANLEQADLQHTNFFNAHMIGANLQRADLQDADLRKARLTEAVLNNANLQGADFQGAGLKKATLQKANLQGANFVEANDLTPEQIKEANCWPLAIYDNNFLKKLGLKEHYRKVINKESRYNLEGLNLQKADLRGADLKNAILQKVDLKGANLEDANLEGADLTGAKNLTRYQLNSAKSYEGARLPDYLRE